jgi:hypothetical protein
MTDLRGVKDDVRAIQERNERSGPAEVERLKLIDAMRKRELTQEVELMNQRQDALRQMRELRDEMTKIKRAD